jgi:hypothetical protein
MMPSFVFNETDIKIILTHTLHTTMLRYP